ncbi:MAG: aspartate carbamoyltransferase catalytic subunit [Saprospiraceae bacterium]|jgi:aspartate carbamoyltransferase catalytic subunit
MNLNNENANLEVSLTGQLLHFLTTSAHDRGMLTRILDLAATFIEPKTHQIKKSKLLDGKTVINVFFEPSTRTRTTFEIAAKRLGAEVINLDASRMSTTKGETILDTIHTLEAMHVDLFVVRDRASGASQLIAQHLPPHVKVINAGDGRHAHPTQAMLDMFTLRQAKGSIEGLTVAIVGDVLHSRVARSQIHALRILGAKEIRVIGPRTLIPTKIESMGVIAYSDMDAGLQGVDAIMMLRLQHERMDGQQIPSQQEYFDRFGLTQSRVKLAAEKAIVMHPGPMNRGLEIASDVADGPQSVILAQVTNGIVVRMAIMAMLLDPSSQQSLDR